MNRLIAFFKRLFKKKEEQVVVTNNENYRPSVAPPVNMQDVNFLAWQAYQEEIKRTGRFPTTPAEPKPTMTTEEYQKLTGAQERTYEEYLKDKYGAVPQWGPDLTPEQATATATKRDNSQLPEPPYFVFVGDKPEMQIFNTLVKNESQQAAYKYLMQRKWNILGNDFREQASKYFDAALISRIINTYASGGGGKYFKS